MNKQIVDSVIAGAKPAGTAIEISAAFVKSILKGPLNPTSRFTLPKSKSLLNHVSFGHILEEGFKGYRKTKVGRFIIPWKAPDGTIVFLGTGDELVNVPTNMGITWSTFVFTTKRKADASTWKLFDNMSVKDAGVIYFHLDDSYEKFPIFALATGMARTGGAKFFLKFPGSDVREKMFLFAQDLAAKWDPKSYPTSLKRRLSTLYYSTAKDQFVWGCMTTIAWSQNVGSSMFNNGRGYSDQYAARAVADILRALDYIKEEHPNEFTPEVQGVAMRSIDTLASMSVAIRNQARKYFDALPKTAETVARLKRIPSDAEFAAAFSERIVRYDNGNLPVDTATSFARAIAAKHFGVKS